MKKTRIKTNPGSRFGWWTVIKEVPPRNWYRICLCRCRCGIKREVKRQYLILGRSKSCGCYRQKIISERKMEQNPNWKGGSCRSKDAAGYIRIRIRKRRGKNKFMSIGEHILIMEQLLGRKLHKGETVHHINGVRDDNRIENLELWASNHSKGSRVKDLVSWAKKLLKEYAPELLA